MQILNKKKEDTANPKITQHRRAFLKYAGISAGATALLIAGCKKDDDKTVTPTDPGISLGTGDIAVLNYAYALEQLEAAFYTMVVTQTNFTTTFPDAGEQALLKDIQAHEVIHREFFKAALGTSAIGSLEVDFSSINFNSRASVLGAAKTFEDLGVSAYNGAGKLIITPAYLTLAGKIVSVEARHAAAIRDMLSSSPKNSADFSGDDAVDATTGLDKANCPSVVLAAASTYIKTKINASTLPTC